MSSSDDDKVVDSEEEVTEGDTESQGDESSESDAPDPEEDSEEGDDADGESDDSEEKAEDSDSEEEESDEDSGDEESDADEVASDDDGESEDEAEESEDDGDSEEKAESDEESEGEDSDESDDSDGEGDSEADEAEEKAESDEDSGDGDESEEDDDSDSQAGSDSPDDDRRQSGRKGVKLSRLIASKIIDGDSSRDCYLHLVDISEGGLRINSDDPFPDDREFVLEIGLAPFGTELATKAPRQAFPVKTVWSKSLVGGMVVSGLAFQNLDKEGQEIVEAIMQGASPQGRRMHFRLNRVLGVELGRDEEEQQWLYPLTLDLSVEGMRICLSEPLEVGAKFPIKIFLEFELPTVKADAEVMWQETMPSGRVQVGLKFANMSERDAMAIKTYIDQCLQQDEAHRRL